MKKLLFLTLILLVSVGWAVAQNPATPGATPDQSQQPGAAQSPSAQPGAPAQQPGMASPADQASQAGQDASEAAAGSSVEGCLGGAAGNFTLTDKSGTTYQLQLPAGADSSKLTSHVGEEVRVSGTTSNAKGGSDASAASAGGTAGGSQSTIAVTKIDKISDKCGSNAQTPPSK